jgi:hypothetical protein
VNAPVAIVDVAKEIDDSEEVMLKQTKVGWVRVSVNFAAILPLRQN